MVDIQMEHAYLKEPTIFQNKKRVLLGETGKEKLPRYYKNIGLGFKTPKEVIEGPYIDKKCPFTVYVSIGGQILSGVVTKMKMQRTIIICQDYLHYIRKYNCFEKNQKNMSIHLSLCFRGVQISDIVTVGECQPPETCMIKHVTISAKISCQSAFLCDPFAHRTCYICHTEQPVHLLEN
ncbi:40S ribosomal protein S11-like [Sapajus apella]|uniref:40S ribosomal protein S11-like n=1 Tax=Sapajus apella TaxID=9515 RepID=A0A6J3JH14_SAPAP|nr:40S ribosomal protein S11-like [Sapajus apella]